MKRRHYLQIPILLFLVVCFVALGHGTALAKVNEGCLGGVTLDLTENQIVSKLGAPKERSEYDGVITLTYSDIMISINDGKIAWISSLSDDVSTASGIHQKSPISDVIATYGTGYTTINIEDQDGYVMQYNEGDINNDPFWLQFFVKNNDDKVDFITIMQYEESDDTSYSVQRVDIPSGYMYPEEIGPTVDGGMYGNGYYHFSVISYVCRYCGHVETIAQYDYPNMAIPLTETECPANSGGHSGTIWYHHSYMWTDGREVWGNEIPGEWTSLNDEINYRDEMESIVANT